MAVSPLAIKITKNILKYCHPHSCRRVLNIFGIGDDEISTLTFVVYIWVQSDEPMSHQMLLSMSGMSLLHLCNILIVSWI